MLKKKDNRKFFNPDLGNSAFNNSLAKYQAGSVDRRRNLGCMLQYVHRIQGRGACEHKTYSVYLLRLNLFNQRVLNATVLTVKNTK